MIMSCLQLAGIVLLDSILYLFARASVQPLPFVDKIFGSPRMTSMQDIFNTPIYGQTFFLSRKYPVFRHSGNQSVLTLETIFLCFSYLHVSTPFLSICTHRAASFYLRTHELIREISQGIIKCKQLERVKPAITARMHVHHGADFRRCCGSGHGKRKRQALRFLVQMLMNNTRLIFIMRFIFICLLL